MWVASVCFNGSVCRKEEMKTISWPPPIYGYWGQRVRGETGKHGIVPFITTPSITSMASRRGVARGSQERTSCMTPKRACFSTLRISWQIRAEESAALEPRGCPGTGSGPGLQCLFADQHRCPAECPPRRAGVQATPRCSAASRQLWGRCGGSQSVCIDTNCWETETTVFKHL